MPWVRLRGLWAAGTAGLSLWIMALLPTSAALNDGWQTPIIALELARTPADVAFLMGDEHAELRQAIDAAHVVDMAFPWAYAGLLLLTLLRLKVSTRLRAIAAVLTGIVVLADIRENLVLLSLTEAVGRGNPIEALLGPLALATWVKWGAIAGLLALIGAQALPRRRWGWVALSIPAVLLTPAAGLTGSPALGEAMGLSVTVTIALLVLHALAELVRSARGRLGATP